VIGTNNGANSVVGSGEGTDHILATGGSDDPESGPRRRNVRLTSTTIANGSRTER